jgi:arylsulfatase A-like enzyme
MDIAPTVLYLLGEPIPRDMDGQVLRQALDPAAVETLAPEYGLSDSQTMGSEVPTYSKEDEAVISERLRGLGYMD